MILHEGLDLVIAASEPFIESILATLEVAVLVAHLLHVLPHRGPAGPDPPRLHLVAHLVAQLSHQAVDHLVTLKVQFQRWHQVLESSPVNPGEIA